MFQNTVHGECIYGNLLNGEWVESDSGKQLEIHSPVDGSLIGKIQAMTKQEVDEAIRDTKMHVRTWAETPIYERAEVFYRAADLLEERAQEIAEILTMEVAKERNRRFLK